MERNNTQIKRLISIVINLFKSLLKLIDIHLEDLQRERIFIYNEINGTKDEELKGLLNRRLEQINREIKKRDPAEENHLTKFLGPFSYFVGVNFKELFLFIHS